MDTEIVKQAYESNLRQMLTRVKDEIDKIEGISIYDDYSKFPTITKDVIVYAKSDFEDTINSVTYKAGFYFGELSTLKYTIIQGEGDGTFLTEDIEVKGIIDGFGYADGDIISKETTSNDFVKKLMRRVVHPNYIAPTLSFTASPSIVEIGVDTEITFTPTYVQNDAGSLIEFIVNQDSTPTYSDTTSVSQFSKNYTLAGDSIFEANVEYEDGIIKQNNFGEDDEVGRILANIISKSVTVKAVYPYYVGVLDTLDETNIKTLTKKVEVKENKDIAFTTTGLQTVVFAYPKSYGVLSSIINQNNYEVLTNFTLNKITINSIEYNVYSLSNVNLDNFKYTFKY